jgi:hypothetical protein
MDMGRYIQKRHGGFTVYFTAVTEECRLLRCGAMWLLLVRLGGKRRLRRGAGNNVTARIVPSSRIFFHFIDGGDTFPRNVCSNKTYKAPHSRRRHCSYKITATDIINTFLRRIAGAFGLCPTPEILDTTKHNVSKTGFASVLR